MPNKKRILNLYTLYFPQGNYEAFIETELPYLCNAFDEVRIFPFRKLQKPSRAIPDNASVVYTESDQVNIPYAKVIGLLNRNLFKINYLKSLKYQVGVLRGLLAKKQTLKMCLNPEEDPVHYTYWFDEWATVLGLLAKENSISKYLSRAHGFDVYDERQSIGYHPYRSIQLNGLSKLFPVSEMGSEYLSKRLPGVDIQCRYLGTSDHGLGPRPSDDVLRVISVAKVIPLKRIERIVKSLSLCKTKVHWTHCGDGSELESVRSAAASLPKNVQVDLLGALSHQEVMDIYAKKPYHLLISLSSTEGLPVSMMEAMSYGIPVLSTNVGGVSEIVNEKTGYLVPKYFTDSEVAQVMDEWILTGMNSSETRNSVRRYWNQNFSAEVNYTEFCSQLMSVIEENK